MSQSSFKNLHKRADVVYVFLSSYFEFFIFTFFYFSILHYRHHPDHILAGEMSYIIGLNPTPSALSTSPYIGGGWVGVFQQGYIIYMLQGKNLPFFLAGFFKFARHYIGAHFFLKILQNSLFLALEKKLDVFYIFFIHFGVVQIRRHIYLAVKFQIIFALVVQEWENFPDNLYRLFQLTAMRKGAVTRTKIGFFKIKPVFPLQYYLRKLVFG